MRTSKLIATFTAIVMMIHGPGLIQMAGASPQADVVTGTTSSVVSSGPDCTTFKKADVSELTYPEGKWFLLEGKIKATSVKDPSWIKVLFIRHDGDATGADKRQWVDGETQQLAAFHMTSGSEGRPIRMRVVSDKPICVSMVQFKLYPLPGEVFTDIQKS